MPLDLLLPLHRDLAQIDPAPFRYIDGGAETDFLPPGHIDPILGNYPLAVIATGARFLEAVSDGRQPDPKLSALISETLGKELSAYRWAPCATYNRNWSFNAAARAWANRPWGAR